MPHRKEARLREFAVLLSAQIDELKSSEPCSKDAFRAVADLMPTAVWTATRSGEVTYFNRRWHEMFSSSDWRALIHPDDRQATFEAWQYAVMTGRPYINLARYRDVTGTYHGLISQAHTVLDSQGRIAYWVGNSIKSAEWPAEVLQVA